MERKRILLLGISLLLAAALPASAVEENRKPFTIPEIKEWRGGSGVFTPTSRSRVICKGKSAEVKRIARQFADDYERMFGVSLEVSGAKPAQGDFVLGLVRDKSLGGEGYTIKIDRQVLVSAQTAKGLLWATQTLLQMSEQEEGRALSRGVARDVPEYGVRGFMLDCGRKFFPMRVLRQYVRMLSYYKMNFFHIHLNDNGFRQFFDNDWNKTYGAFRMECETFPGLAARDGYYTKREFMELQELADSLGVEIVPEIDVPAHSLPFTHYKPEIGSKEYGMDHLDLFNPETYTFLDALFKEYLGGEKPVFRGRYMHIGTDEYSNEDQAVVERFRYFADHYIRYVESFGKTAVIWGHQTHAKGETPVKSDGVLLQAWSKDYSDPEEMIEKGYDIISIPDNYVYIVPAAGYYYDYLDTEWLYGNWTPAHVCHKVIADDSQRLRGGMFAVWNDIVGNGISTQDVHYRFFPALQTLAAKLWSGGHVSLAFSEFDKLRLSLSEAPALNVAGRYRKGTVLERAAVRNGDVMGIDEIGWDYEVSFDIEAAQEAKGTALFSSVNAVFYLSDPAAGMIGFSRDGCLNRFNYQFYPGEKAHVMVKGSQKETALYIDGKCVDTLDIKKINFGKRGDMYYVRTLVFPLRRAGDGFKSIVTNLKVASCAE